MDTEIFTKVQATLCPDISSNLPPNFENSIQSQVHIKTQCDEETKEIEYVFMGTLESIICAHNKIRQLLDESMATPSDEDNTPDADLLVPDSQIRVLVQKPMNQRTRTKYCSNKGSEITGGSSRRRSNRSNAGSKYKAMKSLLKNAPAIDITVATSPSKIKKTKDSHKGTSNSSKKDSQFKHFCHICSFKTKRISHFNKHLAIHSKSTALYRCHHCTFTTLRLGHLRRHELTHSSTIQKCELCSYETDDFKLLLRHVKLKHNIAGGAVPVSTKPVSQSLQCDKCPYKSQKRHLLERHLRIHGVRSYQCELCCYRTWRKEHFVRHVNNVHKNKRNYLCHLCGKAFKRGDALRQHQMTHADETENMEAMSSYPCNTCNKVFRSQSHLFEHNAVHSNDRSFLCEICGASFKTRSVQRKHVQTIHKNPRAHSCTFCSKRFNTLYSLKRHLKVHSDIGKMTLEDLIVTDIVEDGQTDQEEILESDIIDAINNPKPELLDRSSNISIVTLSSDPANVARYIEAGQVITTGEVIASGTSNGAEVTTAVLYLTNSHSSIY